MSCLRFLSVGSLSVLRVGSPQGQSSPATLWKNLTSPVQMDTQRHSGYFVDVIMHIQAYRRGSLLLCSYSPHLWVQCF